MPSLIVDALPQLIEDLLESRFPDVAHAIMTTEPGAERWRFAEVPLKGGEVRIAGMTKGSGMIQPNMATTLGFVMTDAAISADSPAADAGARGGAQLQPAVRGWRHFDERHVAAAGQRRIRHPAVRARAASRWKSRCTCVMEDLAEQIARDGEGATKLITIALWARRTRSRPRRSRAASRIRRW